MTTAELTAARELTHGRFADNSENFKRLVRAIPFECYDERAWYAIAGIYSKLARLASTGRLEKEHVEDVGGYAAKLMELIE